jgi:hypothetical protein
MKALSVSILSLFTILLYCVSSFPVASSYVDYDGTLPRKSSSTFAFRKQGLSV